MDTDIRDEIDRSFGDGPPIDDHGPLIARGHAAVRRRWLVEGGSLLLVAAGVTVIALLSTGGATKSASPGPAGTPTSAVAPTPEPTVVPEAGVDLVTDPHLARGVVIELRTDGLHVSPGVRLPQTIDNPFDLDPPAASFAAVYVQGGASYWYAGYVDESGSGSATMPVRDGMRFRDWVADQAPIMGPGASGGEGTSGPWPGNPALKFVHFVGDTEQLRPASDITILEQRAHPALPDSYASAADRSAVAEVEVEGVRWYVLARQIEGDPEPQFISVQAAKGGATLDDFLELARERYAEGGGGLL